MSLAEAVAGPVGPDAVESVRTRAAVAVFAALAGIDTLASLGVVAVDEIERLRARLAAVGLQTRHHTMTGSGSVVTATPASAPRAQGDRANAISTSEPAQRGLIGDWRARTGPPPGEAPGVLALHRVLGRSTTVAVTLVEIHAYTTGLQMHLLLHGRGDHPPFTPDSPALAARMGVEVASTPRLAVRLPDGEMAVTLGRREVADQAELFRTRPLLAAWGGGGSNDRFTRTYYLTPLPGDAFTVIFSWPEQQLTEMETEISAADVATATSSITTMWPTGAP